MNSEITIKSLQEYAKRTGKDITITGATSVLYWIKNKPYSMDSTDYSINVGIELKPNVYYWWKGFELNENETLFFNHRYNRASGATQRTFNKGYEAKKEILEKLNA